jgi:hypothetical protein
VVSSCHSFAVHHLAHLVVAMDVDNSWASWAAAAPCPAATDEHVFDLGVSSHFSEAFHAEQPRQRRNDIFIERLHSLPPQVMCYYASIAVTTDLAADFFDSAVA